MRMQLNLTFPGHAVGLENRIDNISIYLNEIAGIDMGHSLNELQSKRSRAIFGRNILTNFHSLKRKRSVLEVYPLIRQLAIAQPGK